MKSKVITGLKKDILVIELPENTKFDVIADNSLWKDGVKFLTGKDEDFNFIEGNYTLLGKPDEIKEEDVRSLVSDFDAFENSKYYYLHGFWKLIESEIYWNVNPVKLFDMDNLLKDKHITYDEIKKFNEAELCTFDRKRTLIFVKK